MEKQQQKQQPVMANETDHEHWLAGRVGGYGSFRTALYQAYTKADAGNSKRLQQVFPEWFKDKYELPANQQY